MARTRAWSAWRGKRNGCRSGSRVRARRGAPSPPRPSSPRGRGGGRTKKTKNKSRFFHLPPLPRGEEGRGGEGPGGADRSVPRRHRSRLVGVDVAGAYLERRAAGHRIRGGDEDRL